VALETFRIFLEPVRGADVFDEFLLLGRVLSAAHNAEIEIEISGCPSLMAARGDRLGFLLPAAAQVKRLHVLRLADLLFIARPMKFASDSANLYFFFPMRALFAGAKYFPAVRQA